MAYFPFMIEIKEKNCLVVGGGSVAFHKVKLLSDFGVRIKVVGKNICPELKEWAVKKQQEKVGIELFQREFSDYDVEEMDFVIAATNDEKLNGHISDLCQQRRILVNAVDQKEACSFIFPAIVQEKDLFIAVSTNGQSPAMAAHVKKQIRQNIPEYYGEMVEQLGEYRDYILAQVNTAKKRKAIFNQLIAYGDTHEGKIPKEVVKQVIVQITSHKKETGE